MVTDRALEDLRVLANWFGSGALRTTVAIERVTRRLGTTAVPMLGREVRGADPARREAARQALALLAQTPARDRVIAELHAITTCAVCDESKVCALGLLSELGEPGAAKFA